MKFRIAALAPLIVLGSAVTAGLTAIPAYAKAPALLSLTMEHFRDTATVKDDAVDAVTTISTENGFVERKGPMRMVWSDEYLRSVIDRKTGQKSFQVYALTVYNGNWRSYETVNYETAAGTKSVPAVRIGKEGANCAVGDCQYTERIAFPVDEQLLRRLAAGYVPGKPTIWAYKLIARVGPDHTGGLSSAEIAGFLARVDETANSVPVLGANPAAGASPTAGASLAVGAGLAAGAGPAAGASPAAKANAAGESVARHLGIGGLPVAATLEQPNRAGILVFGVTSGSVAQKSGIIIGDIIYEFDGHPIRALAELEAAVAASAANSTATIKLHRGTNDLTMTARF
jgi:hypothetical protein